MRRLYVFFRALEQLAEKYALIVMNAQGTCMVSIFKVWLYVNIHLGVFTGGYLQNYLTLYNLKGFQCACCVRPICVNKRNYLCLTARDYLCKMNGMIVPLLKKGPSVPI